MRPTTPEVLPPVESIVPPTRRRTGRRAALAGPGLAAAALLLPGAALASPAGYRSAAQSRTLGIVR